MSAKMDWGTYAAARAEANLGQIRVSLRSVDGIFIQEMHAPAVFDNGH